MKIKRADIQPALDVLVALHDDKKALKKIMFLGGLQHSNVVQAAIAGAVRLLMKLRDRER